MARARPTLTPAFVYLAEGRTLPEYLLHGGLVTVACVLVEDERSQKSEGRAATLFGADENAVGIGFCSRVQRQDGRAAKAAGQAGEQRLELVGAEDNDEA